MTLKKALHQSFVWLTVAVMAMTLASCGTGGPRRPGQSNVDRAESLVRAGDHASAAPIYERLAGETTGADSAEFRLRAARAWLAAARAADAERVLASMPAGLTQQQTLEQSLLRISAAQLSGRGEDAWREIAAMPVPTPPAGAARYYETRQSVAIGTGRLLEGIRAEAARERFQGPGDQRQSRIELLAQLRAAAERGASLTPPAGTEPTARGWLEAASVALDNARNPTLGITRIAAFRQRFPAHPALPALANEPSANVEEPPSRLEPAPHLALLLPLSGRTAAPAAQIRDGFLTAYYELPANARPRLRMYDTAVAATADTIAEAHAAGANFIVGPLTREEVVAASELMATRPPVLALNFLPADRTAPERFYQFALSPEDDARMVARYLVASGRRRGVVLTPESDWGTRVAAAFSEELRAAGGYVLGQASFGSARNDYGTSITQVLRTDDSRARGQRIQAAIGQKLEIEPRRRPDIQFIFAPSQPGAARLLRPQLRFHLVGDIPTYTLGDAYEPHPTANQEIDGMMFPDMPWMVGSDPLVAGVREAARQAFGESVAKRGRLFAFGYDALRIAMNLQRGGTIGGEGLTGTLTLDSDGRVRRELDWVQIKSGAPKPLEALPADPAAP
jgi:outer membrane PBP1 activator LpoA protein